MNTNTARNQYRTIRDRAFREARSSFTTKEFDAQAKELIRGEPTPGAWIAAAQLVRTPCAPCAGTGHFITHVENGEPRGPGGVCFRCRGKGGQDYADVCRNLSYDLNYRRNY